MPFFPGTPVDGARFYGRQGEVERALGTDWAWICGQRRMGKTSLLRRMGQEVEARGDLALHLDLSRVVLLAAAFFALRGGHVHPN